MKHYLLCFVFCVVSLLAMADDHLSFKGIPMSESLDSFCQKLVGMGFVEIEKQQSFAWLSGVFTGQEATVAVGADSSGRNIEGVLVGFNPSKEWLSLASTYDHYKDLYSQKYGMPTSSKEKNPSTSKSNISLMYELLQGRVEYKSIWKMKEGIIILSIDKFGDSEGVVSILYSDNQNAEIKRRNDLDDI